MPHKNGNGTLFGQRCKLSILSHRNCLKIPSRVHKSTKFQIFKFVIEVFQHLHGVKAIYLTFFTINALPKWEETVQTCALRSIPWLCEMERGTAAYRARCPFHKGDEASLAPTMTFYDVMYVVE